VPDCTALVMRLYFPARGAAPLIVSTSCNLSTSSRSVWGSGSRLIPATYLRVVGCKGVNVPLSAIQHLLAWETPVCVRYRTLDRATATPTSRKRPSYDNQNEHRKSESRVADRLKIRRTKVGCGHVKGSERARLAQGFASRTRVLVPYPLMISPVIHRLAITLWHIDAGSGRVHHIISGCEQAQ
jgi:hypothetical protein